ncbi:hypothetical protein Lupro_08230 [Lutibacter profundi]|uniref:Uncharacterized protein n=1 Tax=Lutibacter profundi TaxID=1622118 RepID=A0A0X8G716_9FLAO|nr:hypothetical protein [Lutibacter profundi]AMC11241.1 hypothetical protein Lupro_08230 [Lutibacter profundi]
MTKLIVRFCIKLLLIISIVFSIHIGILYFLNIPLFENKIILAYIVNVVLAIVIFIGLIKLKKDNEQILGFVFLIGSFLKFTIFFLYFYPIYKQDGNMSTLEATSFLTPYFACLTVEIFYLSKLLTSK